MAIGSFWLSKDVARVALRASVATLARAPNALATFLYIC